MIDVRQAVAAAIAYVQSFPDLMPTTDLRLEETEYDDRLGEWTVTLSFTEPGTAGITLIGTRAYKTFRVDGQTGVVKSMKARTFYSKP